MIDPGTISALTALTSARAPAREPGGEAIAFIANDSGMPQVWLHENGTSRQLTHHPEPVNAVAWSPKGGTLLFTADVGGDERWQLHLLDVASGQIHALTNDPMTVHMWGAWSADGTRVACTANPTDKSQLDIQIIDVATGTMTTIGGHAAYQEVLAFTPAGDALLVRRSLGAGSDQKLELVDIASGTRTPVLDAPKRVKFIAARLLKSGGGLAICDHEGDRAALWRFDGEGLSMGLVHADDTWELDALALTPDQTGVVVAINCGGLSRLRHVDLNTGGLRDIALPFDCVLTGPSIPAPGDRLLATITSSVTPTAAWSIPLDGGPATAIAAPALPEDMAIGFRPAVAESFASFDGEQIPWFGYTPAGERPSAGWPTIFIIHGGPEMQWRPDFRADVQWMVSQGIQVIAPNVRGSTGYGRRFHALDDREKRHDALADVEALRQHLVAAGRIDPARCGIFGRSYGGWMVMAAVTENPASWTFGINFYGIGNFFTHLLATGPWGRALRAAEYGDSATDPALLTRISPIFQAAAIQAPLFMVHADRDPRVPLTESETIFAVLFGLGKPCEFLRIQHAGHGFLRKDQAIRVFDATARFIARHF